MKNGARIRTSVAFDWLMAVLAAMTMAGVLVDGWAHTHGEVDQSFLTPWHALLYGSVAVNGLVYLAAGIIGLRRGYSFANALPYGYWTSALGVTLFLVAGGFDGWWHTVFGIESGIVLLISPPHLILAFSAAMMMSGPLRSIGHQYDSNAGGWKRIGPAIIATWGLLTLICFFLAYAQPIEDGFTPFTMQPSSDRVTPMVYAAQLDGTLARLPLAKNPDLAALAISPDGRSVAYRVDRFQAVDSTPPSDIYIADSTMKHPREITRSGRHDTYPAWSPDGTSLAYVSMPAETSGRFELHVVAPDGSRDRVVLQQQTSIGQLAWSPDGSSIAYASRNGTAAMVSVVRTRDGAAHWLPFTAGAAAFAWSSSGFYTVDASGTVKRSAIDGSNPQTVLGGANDVALSRDGNYIAYRSGDLGSTQLFVASADGSNARDLSQLSGVDVQSVAWSGDGRIYFTASGRSAPVRSDVGKSLAMTAMIVEGILVAAAALFLIRRWRLPAGALTLLLTTYALAMAMQSDLYVYAIGAFITGLAGDAAVWIGNDRIRSGAPLYALGFTLPLLFTAWFQIITAQMFHGDAWVWNLSLGAPMLAGAGGLAVAFLLDLPLSYAGAQSAQWEPSASIALSGTEVIPVYDHS